MTLNNNKELPSIYQTIIHYVYTHRHPITRDVVYVGMGKGDRAWSMQVGMYPTPSRRGGRSKEHFEWFKSLEQIGYTLQDIVELEFTGLSKEEAFEKELSLIKEIGYINLFNIDPSLALRQYNSEIEEIFKLRNQGLSYEKISSALNISTMSVWRYINVY